MAKKKKRPAHLRKTATPVGTSATPGSGLVWSIAITGLLLLLTIPLATWVSISGEGKTVFSLLGDSLRHGNVGATLALVTILVTALIAVALPFVPVRLWMRDSLATFLALFSGLTLLVTVILTQSTRNILAFGGGRQVTEGGLSLTYLLLGAITVSTLAYLARLDSQVSRRSPQLVWFGALGGVLLILLVINYSLIPGSIISPPDFILRQLGR